MTDFALAHAADAAPDVLAGLCAEQLRGSREHTAAFVYVTAPISGSLERIVAQLQERTGITTWAATAGLGIAATGRAYFDRPAIVVLTMRLGAGDCRAISPILDIEDVVQSYTPGFMAGLAVVHADPRNPRSIDIIARLSSQLGAYLVGGLTAGDGRSYPQICGPAQSCSEGGVSGLLLGGSLNLAVGLTQGCTPIGPTHHVTRSAGNALIMLDDMPAYDVLREDLGVADGADARPWLRDIHAAVPVAGTDQGDYLVRNLLGIEEKLNVVVIAHRVTAGDRVMFVRRDSESAAKDLKRMLDDIGSRLKGPPRAGLYFSCCARGPNLFSDEHHELKAIQERFGDIPIAGFFGNGEVAHDRVYGYTGVLTLFA